VAIAHKQELVSPRTKKASGFIDSKTGSILISICPAVVVAFTPAAFKK